MNTSIFDASTLDSTTLAIGTDRTVGGDNAIATWFTNRISAMRAAAAKRALMATFARMDIAQLRDIGVDESDIYRIQNSRSLVSQAWS
jgi:uncharacterized protein YjiS (DUF1127 family)